MPTLPPNVKGYSVKLLPLIAFAVPLALIYLLNPLDQALNVPMQQSFEWMWKGRTFQLFFIWLVALEYILSWENLRLKINKQNKPRVFAFVITLCLPTLYLLFENYFGLNITILTWTAQNRITFPQLMPLGVEYLIFSILFCAMVFLSFGKKGLTGFALPALFVGLIGVIYIIDNVFPYGQFTPFQLLVPTTTALAAGILGLMGNTVLLGTDLSTSMPTIQVTGPLGTAKYSIAWPCAGIESLLIFMAVALLFLKRMSISRRAKVGYFVFGAAITYLINILRIASIFTIGMQFGVDSNQVEAFHSYYGPLYGVVWIISYPLFILASQIALQKYRNGKTSKVKTLQPTQLNPA